MKVNSRPQCWNKAVAMLRAEFIKAREYSQKLARKDEDKKPGRDLHLEVLARVLDRKMPLLVTAQHELSERQALPSEARRPRQRNEPRRQVDHRAR